MTINESSKNLKIIVKLVICGLKVKKNCFSCTPINLEIIKQSISSRSIEIVMEIKDSKDGLQKYIWKVNQLPTQINPSKMKITVRFAIIKILFTVGK